MKPAFWSDAKIAELSDAVRLFYIGLWMVADDGGYLRVDLPEIAAELYRYQSRPRRERAVTAHFGALEAAGRVRRLDCGVHAVIPKLGEHQHLASEAKQVRTTEKEHRRDCSRMPAETRENPSRRGKEKVMEGEGQGKVSEGKVSAEKSSLRDELHRRGLAAVV